MRVVIVSCVFPPEPVTSARTSKELAVGLVDSGHEVTVITSVPSRPGGRTSQGYRRSLKSVHALDPSGFQIIRTPSWFAPNASLLPATVNKLLENLTFGLTAAWQVLFQKADVVYGNTWPIFAGGLLALACRLRKTPLVLSIQDIHPEAALSNGQISKGNQLVLRILQRIDKAVVNSSRAVITIASSFADYYRRERQIPREKLHVISNWMDADQIVPRERCNRIRQKMGLSEQTFIAMFAGNMGTVAAVESLIETATLLRDEKNIVFVLAGDGDRRKKCEDLVAELKLENVKFLYPLLTEDFCDVQGAADLMLLPTRESGALTSVPSKLIAYMLSGRPVLAAVTANSETARIIDEAQCGLHVEPEDAVDLADAIRALRDQPNQLRTMGQQSRAYAKSHFTREMCVPRVIEILEATQEDEKNSTREPTGEMRWKPAA